MKRFVALLALLALAAAWIVLQAGHGQPGVVVPDGARPSPVPASDSKEAGVERLPADTREAKAAPPATGNWKSEQELFAAHLKVAPTDLQDAAARLFFTQAEHFASQVNETSSAGGTFDTALKELDDRFAERLRRVCCEKLAQRKGLLLVEGFDYERSTEGKKFLIWGGGSSAFGRATNVIVILDAPDNDLEAIDRAFRDLRSVMIAEKLVAFNAKRWEERFETIERYRKARAKGTVSGEWFGVSKDMLPHVVVDENNMCVLPAAN